MPGLQKFGAEGERCRLVAKPRGVQENTLGQQQPSPPAASSVESCSAISEPERYQMQSVRHFEFVTRAFRTLKSSISPGDRQSRKAILFNWVVMIVVMSAIYGTGYLLSQ